ncbi:MAG TPA: hypothetical protein PLY91_04135 [Methanoregulaceae archaeon]|nr:hypothetical protein [Methanoregulaceae archaeon]
MAVGELIGAAIGAMLLIYIAYVLVGGMLTTVETATLTQTEVTHLQDDRLHTMLEIAGHSLENGTVDVSVKNSGSVVIGNFTHMDLYVGDGATIPLLYHHSSSGEVPAWSLQGIYLGAEPERVHIGALDPGETLVMTAPYSGELHWIKVVAGNGATAELVV